MASADGAAAERIRDQGEPRFGSYQGESLENKLRTKYNDIFIKSRKQSKIVKPCFSNIRSI